MRLLIVNGDDFGISEGVNRGIVEAHRRGVLTSATIMANLPALEHAVRLWREHPTLGVGIHLNLTRGAPILPPGRVPTLVGPEGCLLGLKRLLTRMSLGRIDARQVESELCAQVEKVMEAGIRPTHLDSHHHVHAHPFLHQIVVRVALRYGIRGVRCPAELGPGEMLRRAGTLIRRHHLGTAALSAVGALLRRRVRQAGLVAPDHFRGLLLGMAFTAQDLHDLLRALPEGSTELMCHPGHADRELSQRTSYTTGRELELEALLDPAGRALVDRAGIRLGSYADIVDGRTAVAGR